ncbi:hypothetical protein GCM10023211_04720 [Orbus sasakiae]|uniref:NACHT domain-containing protein n=1 Tax=Orbus sasakiae TaxID=1078475 RepID=A0ABP9MZV8_9GAMM
MTMYIERHLNDNKGNQIHEKDIFDSSTCAIILGEPGAGKTDLLNNLANKFETKCFSASDFRLLPLCENLQTLIVDGFDEVTKLDQYSIDLIIKKIFEVQPKNLILSCRASEWSKKSFDRLIKIGTELESKTYYLTAFSLIEQRLYIEEKHPSINFITFITDVARLGFSELLSNPLFLKLFSLTYAQSNKVCDSKIELFDESIEKLAAEHNEYHQHNRRYSSNQIITASEQIFAKLLLSGYSGVTLREALQNENYCYLYALTKDIDKHLLEYTIESQLFKPANSSDLYIPVHRLIAEISAAKYLSRRIGDEKDQLTLKRCLSIIAPNNLLRQELRGLISWLTLFVKDEYQHILIELDPYSIIANGDSKSLSLSTKIKLLHALAKLEKNDPYFRRNDIRPIADSRHFFTYEMIEEVKIILSRTGNSDLFDLVLRSLEDVDNNIIIALFDTLSDVLFDVNQDKYNRMYALKVLSKIPIFEVQTVLERFITENSLASLELCDYLIEHCDTSNIDKKYFLQLFKLFIPLYNNHSDEWDGKFNHNLVKYVVQKLNLITVEYLLDELSSDIKCICGKDNYNCYCKTGISTIIGQLFDRYFELQIMTNYASAERMYSWIKDLYFHQTITSDKSLSVKSLQENNTLRQSIQLLIFSHSYDVRQTKQIITHIHSGLELSLDDTQFIIEYAYENNNLFLWEGFYHPHFLKRSNDELQSIRMLMKHHANHKPEFMKTWAKFNNSKTKRELQKISSVGRNYRRLRKRWEKRNRTKKQQDQEYITKHYEDIKQGKHWGLLQIFAYDYLVNPTNKKVEYDPELSIKALKNSLPFVIENLPTVELTIQENWQSFIMVCHAITLLFFREECLLNRLPPDMLKLVKYDIRSYYSSETYLPDEKNRFKQAIDHCLFDDTYSQEDYFREFITPRLQKNTPHVDLSILYEQDKLVPCAEKLSKEWLEVYSKHSSIDTTKTLFDMCITYESNQDFLKDFITEQCNYYRDVWGYEPPAISTIAKRKFWYIREFLLIGELDFVWNALKCDKNIVLDFNSIINHYSHHKHSWAKFTADKVYKILDAFILVWPEVELSLIFGSGSPPGELAYHFLQDLIWYLDKDEPENTISMIDKMLSDERFVSFYRSLKHIQYTAQQKRALGCYSPPTINQIIQFLDQNRIASVEDLRSLLIEKFEEVQKYLKGAETDPLTVFYKDGKHIEENTARNRLVEYLKPKVEPLNIVVSIEHHMASSNRCDITCTVSIDGKQNLLVIEVKGQWHKELYSAAKKQLYERYAIHPNAADQGIYLVLWYGKHVEIAGKKSSTINSPEELKDSIEKEIPKELIGKIDVFVLDLSEQT